MEPLSTSQIVQPDLAPVQRRKLVDDVYERLLNAILSGQIVGGDPLNELALAEQLQVSRTPVHEAVARLIADGLAQQTGRNRPRVTQFTRGHVVSIYEMRQILEGAASELAATRVALSRVEELRQQGLSLRNATKDDAWPARAVEWDLALHDCLALASGNPYLLEEIQRFRRLVRGFCRITGTVPILLQANAEHLALLDALSARDSSAACDLMRQHIQNRLKDVLLHFDEHPQSSAQKRVNRRILHA
jgi:DNA-binding GntR family transcriptional regulator